jgi:hypothetical protein
MPSLNHDFERQPLVVQRYGIRRSALSQYQCCPRTTRFSMNDWMSSREVDSGCGLSCFASGPPGHCGPLSCWIGRKPATFLRFLRNIPCGGLRSRNVDTFATISSRRTGSRLFWKTRSNAAPALPGKILGVIYRGRTPMQVLYEL